MKKGDTIRKSAKFFQEDINTFEEINVYHTGTRGDYRTLGGDSSDGSYVSIARKLHDLSSTQFLKKSIQNIISGKNIADGLYEDGKAIDPYPTSQKVYLHQLADLIFNCEAERNISALITNAMFFDLLDNNIYMIQDLPDKMPMAMQGAIDAARHIKGLCKLLKVQHFDFKEIKALKSFGDNETSFDNAFLKMQMQLFLLKDARIFIDWLRLKGIGKKSTGEVSSNKPKKDEGMEVEEKKGEIGPSKKHEDIDLKAMESKDEELFRDKELVKGGYFDSIITLFDKVNRLIYKHKSTSEANLPKTDFSVLFGELKEYYERNLTIKDCIDKNCSALEEFLTSKDGLKEFEGFKKKDSINILSKFIYDQHIKYNGILGKEIFREKDVVCELNGLVKEWYGIELD